MSKQGKQDRGPSRFTNIFHQPTPKDLNLRREETNTTEEAPSGSLSTSQSLPQTQITKGGVKVGVGISAEIKEEVGDEEPVRLCQFDNYYAETVEDKLDEQSHHSSEDGSSSWSIRSVSTVTSAGSHAEELEEVLRYMASFLTQDENIGRLLKEAYIAKDHTKLEQTGARLLDWVGKRLMPTASTLLEKKVANLFCSRHRNNKIMEHIIIREDYSENIGPDQRQKQEHDVLEGILARFKYSPKAPSKMAYWSSEMQANEEEFDASFDDADNVDNADNADSVKNEIDANNANNEALLGNYENLEAARTFLSNSNAFLRLEEDLRDFIAPFEDSKIWNKDRVLWDGSQQVRFERHVDAQSPSLIDRMKLSIQRRAGASIRWWPFSQPIQRVEKRMMRIIWPCVSK